MKICPPILLLLVIRTRNQLIILFNRLFNNAGSRSLKSVTSAPYYPLQHFSFEKNNSIPHSLKSVTSDSY